MTRDVTEVVSHKLKAILNDRIMRTQFVYALDRSGGAVYQVYAHTDNVTLSLHLTGGCAVDHDAMLLFHQFVETNYHLLTGFGVVGSGGADVVYDLEGEFIVSGVTDDGGDYFGLLGWVILAATEAVPAVLEN